MRRHRARHGLRAAGCFCARAGSGGAKPRLRERAHRGGERLRRNAAFCATHRCTKPGAGRGSVRPESRAKDGYNYESLP